MADIPPYPTEKTVDTYRDFANLQKEVLDLLMAQKQEYEQIVRFSRTNLDVEKRVVARRVAEKRMMGDIQSKILEHEAQMAIRVGATSDAQRERSNQLLKSLEEEISDTKMLLTLSRDANAIEIEMVKRRYEDEHKYFTFASAQMKNLFGLKVKEFDLTKGIGEELLKIGVRGELIANTIGATLMMLAGAFSLFVKFDKAAWDFRKAMGQTRGEAAAIRKQAQGMAVEFMGVGVSIDGAYKSFQALGQSVGGVHNVTKSMAEDIAIMSAQLGISEETSAGFLRNMAAISKHTMESQVNSLYIAQNMSAAAGVQLDQVMGDIAKKSDKTLVMMSRLPNVALRTAIELRRMGTSLELSAASSRHILDFTENVNEEMEASVLLGRSINLQRARELAYRRDLEGSTKEILRITKSVNFENLDVFQQEAFARATGKSVDELLKMLQTSRQLEHVKRAGTPEQKQQLALYEQMRKSNEAAAKARAKDVSAQLRQMGNQERLTQIQNKWNALLAKAQEFLLPIVDKMLELVLPAMDVGMAIMKWSFVLGAPLAIIGNIGKVMYKVGDAIVKATAVTSKLTGFWMKIANIGLKLMAPWNRIVALVGMVIGKLGFFGKFLGFFGKLLGPIGWVITAFQAIGGFIKGWNSTTGNWIQKLGGGLMGALRNIIPGFDYIVKAVKWVWSHVGDIATFIFKWLTPLGLVIQGIKIIWPTIREGFTAAWSLIKGFFGSIFGAEGIGGIKQRFVDTIKAWAGAIDSFGSYVVKAITFAFNKAFAWVTDKFAGVMKFFGKIFGGGGVESKATAAYIPAATITPTGTTVNPLKKEGAMPAKSVASESEPMSEETGKRMVALLEKIASKDTHINLDGSLVSTQLSRGIEFRGNYGVNK